MFEPHPCKTEEAALRKHSLRGLYSFGKKKKSHLRKPLLPRCWFPEQAAKLAASVAFGKKSKADDIFCFVLFLYGSV